MSEGVCLHSACTSASLEPSYVLRAIGADEDLAHSSIRYKHTTKQNKGVSQSVYFCTKCLVFLHYEICDNIVCYSWTENGQKIKCRMSGMMA